MQVTRQTKTFTGSTASSEWAWKQEIIENTNDDYITTNQSVITVNTYLTRTNSNSYFGGTASCNITVKDSSSATIINKTVSKTFNYPTYVNVYSWLLVQSETFNVNHKADGTQSITVTSQLNTSDFTPNWTSASGTLALTTIPRTSKVTCPGFNIGDSVVINIERASNSFTHTLSYKFGTATGTIVTKTTLTSVGWTPNADTFHSQIPNAKNGKGTITCQTYSGDTLIGTSTSEFTAYVVEDKPTVSATIVDTNTATIDLTGSSSKIVQYYSKPKVTISATAKKKATISSYLTKLGSLQSTNKETTFNTIESPKYSVSATDSRGWSTTTNYDISSNYINYIRLAFTSIDINRTESTSTIIRANLKGNYFAGSFGKTTNTLTMKWRYKKSNSATWGNYTTITPTISGNTFTYNANLGSNFDNNSDYDIELTISDKLDTVSTGIRQVTKGIGLIDIFEDRIVLNGKLNVDTEDQSIIKNLLITVISSSNITTDNLIASSISIKDGNKNIQLGKYGAIAESSNNYIKFIDGTLICNGNVTSDGINYNSGKTIKVSFPVNFVNNSYTVNLTQSTNNSYWSFISASVTSKTSSGMTINLWNNSTAGTSGSCNYDYIAIGRWK